MNLNLSMPPQFVDKLKAEAKRTGMNNSEIVRRAVDEYLERREQRMAEK
jgi:metal-responsive CopG/Arc/MetJ family transcriptional regulator